MYLDSENWLKGSIESENEEFKVTRRETGKILKYGMPIAAQEALTGISFAVIMAILNNFGLVASAGVGVAEKIVGILFLVPGALIKPNSSVGWHRHVGETEPYYILEGEGIFLGDDGHRIKVGPGDVCTILPGECHAIEEHSNDNYSYGSILAAWRLCASSDAA